MDWVLRSMRRKGMLCAHHSLEMARFSQTVKNPVILTTQQCPHSLYRIGTQSTKWFNVFNIVYECYYKGGMKLGQHQRALYAEQPIPYSSSSSSQLPLHQRKTTVCSSARRDVGNARRAYSVRFRNLGRASHEISITKNNTTQIGCNTMVPSL